MRRRSFLLFILTAACSRGPRVEAGSGVQYRGGASEQLFFESHRYNFSATRDVAQFRAWARAQGFDFEPALYRIGYHGPPPQCSHECAVYSLRVGHNDDGWLEKYMIYAENNSIIRIDNNFQYDPR